MKKAILATKIGMTQVFSEDGVLTPVTVLEAGPNVVTQLKTLANDGYDAVQVGFAEKIERVTKTDKAGHREQFYRHGANKPEVGHFKKAGVSPKRFVKEFRLEDCSPYEIAQEIKADIFAVGDRVDVTAISKGKGFQGAIKRHGQSRGPMTHGSKFHRHAGSNGACSTPSRVYKGKGMPGRMGGEQITVQNLTVVAVDIENNVILVKGAVPGPKKGLVKIKDTTRVDAP